PLPHPSSTLFPYTTLFRSRPGDFYSRIGSMTFLHKLAQRLARLKADTRTAVSATAVVAGAVIACAKVATPSSPGNTVSQLVVSRSEEHTSEFQSRGHLVCR